MFTVYTLCYCVTFILSATKKRFFGGIQSSSRKVYQNSDLAGHVEWLRKTNSSVRELGNRLLYGYSFRSAALHFSDWKSIFPAESYAGMMSARSVI